MIEIKRLARFMGVKWVMESEKYSAKTESRLGCMQYSCAESSNISKFVCAIIKSLCAESIKITTF